jgi:hypothetical protein
MRIFQWKKRFPMIFARILIAKPVSTFAEYAPREARAQLM